MNRCFYCGATGNLIDSEYPDSTGWGYPIKACKNQKECIDREKAIKEFLIPFAKQCHQAEALGLGELNARN